MGFPINPPRTPLVKEDGRTIEEEWWRFFLAIQKLIGGASDPFADTWLLGTPVAARADTFGDGQIVAFLQPPPAPALPFDDLMPPGRQGTDGAAGAVGPTGATYAYATSAVSFTETATTGDKMTTITATGLVVTLPTAVGNNARLTYKLMVAGTLVIDGAGAETIDTAPTATLITRYASISLVSDNAGWLVI